MVSLFPHPVSFRSHLTVNTLAFGYILPTTGRIWNLHPLETCAARRTHAKKNASRFYTRKRSSFIWLFSQPLFFYIAKITNCKEEIVAVTGCSEVYFHRT